MKKLSLFFICASFVQVKAQVLCGTAAENGTVTITAPAGNVFTLVEFASYGTPTGSCGSFATSGCHASNSVSQVASVFIGNNTGSIAASNGVFGDPCPGTFKRLYVQLRYAVVVPLTLTSFVVKRIAPNSIRVEWTSQDEVNTSHFIIERSVNGADFVDAGSVNAKGSGTNSYQFSDKAVNSSLYFRLKMVDNDGRFTYSNVVRISNLPDLITQILSANPGNGLVNIVTGKTQNGYLLNQNGQLIKKLLLRSGMNAIDIQSASKGIYFLVVGDKAFKLVRN